MHELSRCRDSLVGHTLRVGIVLLLVAQAGCGGGRLVNAVPPSGISERQDAARWPSPLNSASWDPLAPAIATVPLDEALLQAPVVSYSGYRVTALSLGNRPDTAAIAALRMEQEDGELVIRTTCPLADVALYLSYDPRAERVQRIDAGRNGVVSLAFVVEPGLVAIGLAATSKERLIPTGPIATMQFAHGKETALRRSSTISQAAASAVRDLVAVHEGSGTATLGWHERHTGDYNLDGEVNLSDLTPIGFWYQKPVNPEADNWAEAEVVDGNEDGLVTINDITQIGQNFRSLLTGYNVYRIALASPDDEPTPADEGWIKVTNAADPAGPSAPREGMYNGQKTRLVWTLLDEPEAGLYAWYVAPTGRPGETPFEGPPSNVAKHGSGVLLGVYLTFEIQPPENELLSVGQEFYLGIKVTSIAKLFSANVRFEYDSTLVEFIETAPFYTDTSEHANILTNPDSPSPPEQNPLFVGEDVGEAQGGTGYRLVGFNATKMKGEDARSGTDFLGYAKFRVVAARINDKCFRFPQATTFIYLWGSKYGVPIALPVLGSPQAVNSSGGEKWHIETVDTDDGSHTSLALDASGRPHISYHDSSNGQLKYVRRDGSTWGIETVDTGGVGSDTSIALDASGRPHISYYDGSNSHLKYAWHDGSTWLIETADSAVDVGLYTSLALDASDRPHISYYDGSNGSLNYAQHDGSSWQIETVDNTGDVCWYTSLALDASGRPHISYIDETNELLKYAWHDGSIWQIEAVDSGTDIDWHTSIALDTSGRPHISYHDATPNFDLKYARHDGSTWHIETIDSAGDVGRFPSLALDTAGRPHIGYYDNTALVENLKYAWHDGSTWHIETVDNVSDVGWYACLALDSAGRVHISYMDDFNNDLKYASRTE